VTRHYGRTTCTLPRPDYAIDHQSLVSSYKLFDALATDRTLIGTYATTLRSAGKAQMLLVWPIGWNRSRYRPPWVSRRDKAKHCLPGWDVKLLCVAVPKRCMRCKGIKVDNAHPPVRVGSTCHRPANCPLYLCKIDQRNSPTNKVGA